MYTNYLKYLQNSVKYQNLHTNFVYESYCLKCHTMHVHLKSQRIHSITIECMKIRFKQADTN